MMSMLFLLRKDGGKNELRGAGKSCPAEARIASAGYYFAAKARMLVRREEDD
jgi:hypothetical protein